MSKELDVAYVARVVRQLLEDAGRDVVLEDRAGGEMVVVPPDAAAAPDGLLPVFLSSGEALALDAFGEGFGLKLKRDFDALFSWRVESITATTFSEVLLSTMEALAQASTPRGIMVLDLARVFDEASARALARRAPA
ncbi:hypothetical protein [uncultured Rhodoblastus sp.]|uniref:hypothetical protein n=1 Tax=uncultured Rhodoblastus sp. TaxID=543037 RepID=UPI0025FFD473|nr:hypothetical protein [uncultured Rhodoblastus sp.]